MLTYPSTHSASALAWLDDPPSDCGIRFAGRDDWVFWPWAELPALSRSVAAGLAQTGVRPVDIVAVIERGGPLFVASLFGALLAGATPSPIPPPLLFQNRSRHEEHLLATLRALRPAMVVTGAALAEDLAPVAAAAGSRARAATNLVGAARIPRRGVDGGCRARVPRRQLGACGDQCVATRLGGPEACRRPGAQGDNRMDDKRQAKAPRTVDGVRGGEPSGGGATHLELAIWSRGCMQHSGRRR